MDLKEWVIDRRLALARLENAMKILVINKFGGSEIIDRHSIPSIGSQVDMFYRPYPVVQAVLMWPSIATLDSLGAAGIPIEAIVTVE